MSRPPYALVADVHCHNWSQFSQVNADGINTRLAVILSELKRAARAVKAAGGDLLVVAGDLFHVRGKIEPSVFNPTFDTFREIAEMGVAVIIEPGNHDLEGKHSDKLGNAMQQLQMIDGVSVVTEPTGDGECFLIPWIEDLDELRSVMSTYADSDRDLIIHAPLNGVIKGLPDHGLEPDELARLGYRRVFVGHYHNHKEFVGGVYSIGATTHQTWSDPGTRAGFLLVYEDRVEFNESQAPSFVNIDDPGEIDAVSVAHNYARLRLKDADQQTLEAAKKELEACGALDWVDHSSKKRESVRTNNAGTNNVTLEVSVVNFVGKHLQAGKLSKKRIAVDALEVLREARTVGAE